MFLLLLPSCPFASAATPLYLSLKHTLLACVKLGGKAASGEGKARGGNSEAAGLKFALGLANSSQHVVCVSVGYGLQIWFLICTDLVARGVDFKGVALVINFDLPPSTAVYIHRIGRTGRAGRAGKVSVFVGSDLAGCVAFSVISTGSL